MTLVKRDFLAGRKVLIVDDVVDNQALLTLYLAESGALIDHASNGAEAVDRLDSEKFDVILIDIQMPVMDGYHATSSFEKNRHSHYCAYCTGDERGKGARACVRL